MSDNQSPNDNQSSNEPTVKCLYKDSGENIVKSILYACAISCMAGSMAGMFAKPVEHLFQLTIGFVWFLFYSAYLHDEIYFGVKYDDKSPCKGLDLLGWMLFMIQGCVLGYSGNVSIVVGCIGLMVINLSLHKYKEEKESGDRRRYERWIAENIVILVFMLLLALFHAMEHWLFNDLSLRLSVPLSIVVCIVGCIGFFYKTRILFKQEAIQMRRILISHIWHPVETIRKCIQKEAKHE